MAGRDEGICLPITHQAQADRDRRFLFSAHSLNGVVVHLNNLRSMYNRQAQTCRVVPRELGLYQLLRPHQNDLDVELTSGFHRPGDCCLGRMIAADGIQYDLHARTCSIVLAPPNIK
jgi:hypothetical protein